MLIWLKNSPATADVGEKQTEQTLGTQTLGTISFEYRPNMLGYLSLSDKMASISSIDLFLVSGRMKYRMTSPTDTQTA